jgi:hypothetical protein
MKGTLLILALGLASAILIPSAPTYAQCGTQTIPGYTPPSSMGWDSVRVIGQGFPPNLAGVIMNGASFWNNSSCNGNYGNSFTYFQPAAGPAFTVTVAWVNGTSATNACGDFNTTTRQINIYSKTMVNGQTVDCLGHNPEALAEAVAHELGHFLGLDNTPDFCYAGMMMSASDYNYNTHTFTQKRPSDAECQTADSLNVTYMERTPPPPPDPFCEAYGCPQSPLLIDLDRNGFQLSGLFSPVRFDINADGRAELLAWTRGDQSDGFLVLDLNGNGYIDSGAELFGNHTLLPNGQEASNGYEALAQYDAVEAGGNADGYIDSRDAIYPYLQVWLDHNHNGVSEAGELYSLNTAGVTRIDLRFVETRRQDQFGNRFRYVSRAWLNDSKGRQVEVLTTDVFFKVGEN